MSGGNIGVIASELPMSHLLGEDDVRLVGFDGIVGAIPRNVSRLLTPVANFRLRGLVALTTDMTQTATVVALLTLVAVFCHVS